VLNETLTGASAIASVLLAGLILESAGSWLVVHTYCALALLVAAVLTYFAPLNGGGVQLSYDAATQRPATD